MGPYLFFSNVLSVINTVIALIIWVSFLSCNADKNVNQDLAIFYTHNQTAEFVEWELIEHIQSDSLAKVTYKSVFNKNENNQTYFIPKVDSVYKSHHTEFITEYKRVGKKTFGFKTKVYHIYKIKMDMENSIDEEGYFYYVPEIGIIRVESAHWLNHLQLVQSNKVPLDELYFASQMVNLFK